MLQILLLILTTGGIAAYARGRGGNPWVWGSLSVVGHLAIQFLGPFVPALLGRPINQNGFLLVVLASWAWIGVVAFCVRFLVGMKKGEAGRNVVLQELQVLESALRGDL